MGVRLSASKTYKTQVNFDMINEAGKKEKQSFEAEFKRLTRDQVKDLVESGKSDNEMVSEVMVGWKLTNTDTGEDLPFTDVSRDALLTIPGTGGVTMLAFLETVGASRQKN